MAEVVTGEAVVLEVPCARFPSRLLALVIDMAIQIVLLFVLFLIVGLAAQGGLDTASAGAIGLTLLVNNIFGEKYESNGATYPDIEGGKVVNYNYFFPQAPANFLLSLNVMF